MSVRFRPERNKWEASFVVRGRRIRVLRDLKKDAIEFEKDAKKKQLGIDEIEPDKIEIGEAFKMYFEDRSGEKTSFRNDRRYFNLAHHFLTEVRGLEFLNDISLQDLEALQKWLLKEQILGGEKKEVKEEWRASTVNRAFHTYRHLFSKMCAWGKLAKDPGQYLSTIPEALVNREPLTREIFLKVQAAAPAWFKDVFEFLYHTGARGSSVERLTWEWIDLKARRLHLDSHKGPKAEEKRIELPIIDPVFAVLVRVRNRWPEFQSGPVFRYDNGDPVQADRISKVGCRLIKAAGYPDVDLYGCRHALASELTDAGAPTEVVRQLLGHSNIRTTQAYAKGTSKTTLAAALNLVRRDEMPPDATNENSKPAAASGDSE